MEKQLEQAIIEQLGYEELDDDCKDTLSDVCRGGANAGFGGFIYSSALLEFFCENKSLIIDNQKELASDMGVGLLEMIQGFNCLKGSGLSVDEIGEIVFGNNYDHEMATCVIDALCWSVLENLAFSLDC